MEEGLYKKINDYEMAYAKNKIHYPNGTIINVDDYRFYEGELTDGWYWFQTYKEAYDFFEIKDMPDEPEIPPML